MPATAVNGPNSDSHALTLESVMSELRVALGNSGTYVGSRRDEAPRFELFNAPNSICSQKVRAVLEHHGIAYISYSMDMLAGQTYLPAHVRLRMIGCDRLGVPLMTTHTGSTSVTAGGCDATVVPTLVDWDTKQVIVDSKRICFYLDDTIEDRKRLRPLRLREQIDPQLDVVDNLPNYQMLNGRPPGADRRPTTRRGNNGVDVSMSKVARLDRYLEAYADDAILVRAYRAKHSKELMGAQQLFSYMATQAAYERAEAACDRLEHSLNQRATRWLFGDQMTMADIFWCIELLRMKNLGAQTFWAHGVRPAVAAIVDQAETVPALRAAVLDWPGATY